MESCNLDDGTALDLDISDEEDDTPNGFAGVSSDEDNHDNSRVRNFSVRTGVLDEKAAATQALGAFAAHTKAAFSPYPCSFICNTLSFFNFVFQLTCYSTATSPSAWMCFKDMLAIFMRMYDSKQ